MRSYLEMTPCERIRYYKKEISRMTPPKSFRERILLETFRQLVSENLPLCGEQASNDADGLFGDLVSS